MPKAAVSLFEMFNPTHPEDPTLRFPRQCYFLRINGFWPLAQSRSRKDAYSLLEFSFRIFYSLLSWFVIAEVVLFMYFMLAYKLSVLDQMEVVIEVSCSSLMGFLMLSRMFNLHINQKKLRDLMIHFVADIWIVRGSHPRIERECQRKMIPYVVMTSLMYTVTFMYTMISVMEAIKLGWDSPDKPFPYRMLFFYDAQSKVSYTITYIAIIYSSVIGGVTLTSDDSLLGFFLTYICGQYQILHERIEAIMLTGYRRVRKEEGLINLFALQMEFQQELKDIAIKHSKLIEFVKHVENFWSFTLLWNFLISTALLCMVGFQLATGTGFVLGDYIKFGIFICQTLAQLYMMCWNGDRLLQFSAETADHLYSCYWEGLFFEESSGCLIPASKEFLQNLQIMIMCSQTPNKVTAGKFASLSLQSFLKVLSSSMSYFTVLHTMYNEKNTLEIYE